MPSAEVSLLHNSCGGGGGSDTHSYQLMCRSLFQELTWCHDEVTALPYGGGAGGDITPWQNSHYGEGARKSVNKYNSGNAEVRCQQGEFPLVVFGEVFNSKLITRLQNQ